LSASSFDIGSLRDPVAIAAARAALDDAEEQARIEAERARRRTAEEARAAEEAALKAEIAALAGPWEPVIEARQTLDDLRALVRKVSGEAETAEQQIEETRARLPALVERAVAGHAVTPEEVAEAHAAVTTAEQHAAFRSVIVARHMARLPEAESRLKEATGEAYRPVAERGTDLRINAGRAVDAAFKTSPSGDLPLNSPLLEAAHATFRHGEALIRIAADRGCQFGFAGPCIPFWPTSEAAERRRWNRPAPEANA
jgi:hypothetical protein